MSIIKPYTFLPDTNIDPDEVNQNFDAIYAEVNDNTVKADGSVAFTVPPSGPATDPTSANQLARKQYVDQRIKGGAASFTTDVNGYGIVTHQLGATPTWVVVTGKSPSGGPNIAGQIIADSFTATTFRVRVIDNEGAALSAVAVTISYCCGV